MIEANTTADELEFSLLHRLRIAGRVAADQLPAGTLGAALIDSGSIRRTDRGCTLTAAGLRRHGELLEYCGQTIDVATLADCYDRFLRVNQPVKDACALWQIRAAQAGADEAIRVLDRLEELMERVRPSLRRAAGAASHFATYGSRLDTALDRAAEGDHRFLVDPRLDSFHTVWFECHEDYLLTLGRERSDEEQNENG